MADEYL